MTAAEFETLDDSEVEGILRWRFRALVRSGYDVSSALLLATHVEIDVYEPTTLEEPGETALEMLL